jgi:hypothetical protein
VFLREGRRRLVFAVLLVASIGTYAWLHPDPSQQGGALFTRLSGEVLGLLPGRVKPNEPMAFGDAMSLGFELLRRHAGAWLAAAGAAAAIMALGQLLDRRRLGAIANAGA